MGNYRLSISMNVLENLGLNLYSSIPAVIAETIANSYDADAQRVDIDIDPANKVITIKDDGGGMTETECNKKYLYVGYHKREEGEVVTPKYKRPVMGRKGIGKLSLFSIAKNIEIHTVKLDENDKVVEKNGFIMNMDEITRKIKNNGEKKDTTCDLIPVKRGDIEINEGTKIILTDLQKNLSQTESFLRKKLARKFSILGKKYDFQVYLNGKEISMDDRDYFPKIQYLWFFGKYGKECVGNCKNLDNKEELKNEIVLSDGTKCTVEGWIGTVHERSNLEEGNNTITIHSRGKSIHDDLLINIDNSGFFTKYLIGEIRADFLDDNKKEDISASDRQNIQENNERFEKIRDFGMEVIQKLRTRWDQWRRENATEKACQNPAIEKWFESLKGDNKKYAKQLFGKIDSFPIKDEAYKKEIYKNGILAFQTLAISSNLSKLDEIDSPEGFGILLSVLSEIDQLEAAHYHEIVRGRIKILTKFEGLVDANVKEKVLQEYIFNHLWLLDSSWERADAKSKRMEESVTKEFDKIELTEEEKKGRIDIKYRSSAGKHIIIELKRYKVNVDIDTLQKQIRKYKNTLEKCLEKYSSENQTIEIVCILGSKPKNASEKEIVDTLKVINARYITYDQLIKNTLNGYEKYLNENKKIGEIQKLIESI